VGGWIGMRADKERWLCIATCLCPIAAKSSANPLKSNQTKTTTPQQYCDRGTLRDAVKAGLFHRQLPDGSIGIDIGAVVDVLLDVAYAVQYLHSMQLVHGDIKVGVAYRGRGVGKWPALAVCCVCAYYSSLSPPNLLPHS